MSAASMAGTALLALDDDHAAPVSRQRQLRRASAVSRSGLPDQFARRGASVRRKLCWSSHELKQRTEPMYHQWHRGGRTASTREDHQSLGERDMSSSLIPDKTKGPRDSVTAFRRHAPGTQPDYLYPAYRATRLRAPSQPVIFLPHSRSEVTGPVFGHSDVHPSDSDLTLQHSAEPMGERIILRGRVVDGDGHAVSNSLIEIWQANAAGRY